MASNTKSTSAVIAQDNVVADADFSTAKIGFSVTTVTLTNMVTLTQA